MTTREIQYHFEQAASYHNEVKDIAIKSKDVNFWINHAIRVFINKKIQENPQRKQKDIDDLKDILVSDVSLTLDTSTSDKVTYLLPSDYMYLINDKTTLVYCGATKTVANRLVPSEELFNVLNYSHTKTTHKSPVSNIVGGKINVYIDNFTISSIIIDYLKKPSIFNIFNGTTIELHENTHKDIVELAVLLFVENKNPQRMQLNLQKSAINKQLN